MTPWKDEGRVIRSKGYSAVQDRVARKEFSTFFHEDYDLLVRCLETGSFLQ